MILKHVFVVTLILLLSACAEAPVMQIIRVEQPPQPPLPDKDPFAVLTEIYRARATEAESKGELRQALFAWQVVASFSPDDAESRQKAQTLRKQIRTEANTHFRKGIEYLSNNSMQAARREFLLTLAYDPKHQEALDNLKHKTSEPDHVLYEVKQGDTPASIAQKVYRDPAKDFIVAYFSDVSASGRPNPGAVLRLPILETEPKAEARAQPKAGQKARQSTGQKAGHKAEPKVKQVSLPKVYDKVGAENHYRNGVNYFVDENLQGAIKEWEDTLRLDPGHPNAKKDLEKARRMLESLGSK